MKKGYLLFCVTAALAVPLHPATAAALDQARQSGKQDTLPAPQIFKDLVNCSAIKDAAERLACYDLKVSVLAEAQKNDEVVVTDQEAVKEAKRGLFGFNLPKLKIFGKEGSTTLDELTTTIKSARRDAGGKWVFTLQDGASWQQVDTKAVARDPKPGMTVVIRKAALGTFFVKVDGQTAIRMKRVN